MHLASDNSIPTQEINGVLTHHHIATQVSFFFMSSHITYVVYFLNQACTDCMDDFLKLFCLQSWQQSWCVSFPKAIKIIHMKGT